MKKTFFKSLIILTLCFLLMACAVACTEDTDNLTDENLTNEDIPNNEDNSQSTENQHTHFYASSVIEATCDFDGYTKYTCECGHEYNDNFVNRLNHSFTSYKQNNDATCFSNATETAICDRKGCQQTNTRSIPNSTISHNFVNYIYDGNATCSRDGTKTAQCINDGCIVKDTVSALGTQLKHSFVDYISNNNATCMTNCTETAICGFYGCQETDTRIDIDSKLGHSFVDYISNNNATCMANCTETARCSNNGCLVEDTRQIPNSTLDHNFQNYVSNKDATIERDGTKTAVCENNGCFVTDTIVDEGTQLALLKKQVINDADEYLSDADIVTRLGIKKYLTNKRYDISLIEYAYDNLEIDWFDAALQYMIYIEVDGGLYLRKNGYSNDLSNQLFKQAEIDYALENCDIDWWYRAKKLATSYIESDTYRTVDYGFCEIHGAYQDPNFTFTCKKCGSSSRQLGNAITLSIDGLKSLLYNAGYSEEEVIGVENPYILILDYGGAGSLSKWIAGYSLEQLFLSSSEDPTKAEAKEKLESYGYGASAVEYALSLYYEPDFTTPTLTNPKEYISQETLEDLGYVIKTNGSTCKVTHPESEAHTFIFTNYPTNGMAVGQIYYLDYNGKSIRFRNYAFNYEDLIAIGVLAKN